MGRQRLINVVVSLGTVLGAIALLASCGTSGAAAPATTTPATSAVPASVKSQFVACMQLITNATASQPYYPAQHPECGTGSAIVAAGNQALKDQTVNNLSLTWRACENGRPGTTGAAHWVDPVCKLPWLDFVAAAEKAM